MRRDRIYPYLFGLLTAVLAFLFKLNPKVAGFENVLDGTISFSSIVLGFIAALLAIILSISKSPAMTHLYSYVGRDGGDGRKILFNYFLSALVSGFLTVLLSIYMFIVCNKETIHLYDKIPTYIWGGLVVIFICTTYRIVYILMFTLFKHEIEQTSTHTQTTRPEIDYTELQRRNTRDINREE